MPGTISFGGIGSGLDTEGIVNGLVGAASGPIRNLRNRASVTRAAISTVSDVSSTLARLKSAVEELDELNEASAFTASSNSDAVVVSANGGAQPGAYGVTVTQLASEQRTYTDAFASNTTALSQSGTVSITVGTDDAIDITVDATDTLDDIANKINASDARVSASLFFDGSEYRLQVRGKDTGAENGVTFSETGTSFGLATPANTVQAAQNAVAVIDGFTVNSSTNAINGAIPGVTLALKETTTSPTTVAIDSDPDSLIEKARSAVNAYNDVINKINSAAGMGSIEPTNDALAGDSTLRSVAGQLSETLFNSYGSGLFRTAGAIGINLQNNGTLRLDDTELREALDTDAEAVFQTLAGDDDGANGLMDVLRDVTKALTDPDNLLSSKEEALANQADDFEERAAKEQERLDNWADRLRNQFVQLDSTVAGTNADLSYLTQVFSG